MDETQKEEKSTKPTNCAKCNKQFKKKLWYYRAGKYFCTKTCWHSSVQSEKAPAPAAQA